MLSIYSGEKGAIHMMIQASFDAFRKERRKAEALFERGDTQAAAQASEAIDRAQAVICREALEKPPRPAVLPPSPPR